MDSSLSYLFKGLNPNQMEKVMAIGEQVSMKKGKQIIKEGQAAKGIRLSEKGKDREGEGGVKVPIRFALNGELESLPENNAEETGELGPDYSLPFSRAVLPCLTMETLTIRLP